MEGVVSGEQQTRSGEAEREGRPATADGTSATTTEQAAAGPDQLGLEDDLSAQVEDAEERQGSAAAGASDLAVGASPGESPGRNRKLKVFVERERVEKTIVVDSDSRDVGRDGAIARRAPSEDLSSEGGEEQERRSSPSGVKAIEYVTITEDTNTVTIEESDADDDVTFHKALSMEDIESMTADVLPKVVGQTIVVTPGAQGPALDLHEPAGVVMRIHSPTKVLRREATDRDHDNQIDAPSPPSPGRPFSWPTPAGGVRGGGSGGGDGRGIDQKPSPPPPPSPPPRCRHHASTTTATTSSACNSTTSTTSSTTTTRQSVQSAGPTHYESPLAAGQTTQPTRCPAAAARPPAATAGLSAAPPHAEISEVLAQAPTYQADRESSSSSDCRESAQHQRLERPTPSEEVSEQSPLSQDQEPLTASSPTQPHGGLPLTHAMEDQNKNPDIIPAGGDGSGTIEVREEVVGESGDLTRTVTTVTEHWSTSDKQEAGQPGSMDTLGDLDIRTTGDLVLVSHVVDTDTVMDDNLKEGREDVGAAAGPVPSPFLEHHKRKHEAEVDPDQLETKRRHRSSSPEPYESRTEFQSFDVPGMEKVKVVSRTYTYSTEEGGRFPDLEAGGATRPGEQQREAILEESSAKSLMEKLRDGKGQLISDSEMREVFGDREGDPSQTTETKSFTSDDGRVTQVITRTRTSHVVQGPESTMYFQGYQPEGGAESDSLNQGTVVQEAMVKRYNQGVTYAPTWSEAAYTLGYGGDQGEAGPAEDLGEDEDEDDEIECFTVRRNVVSGYDPTSMSETTTDESKQYVDVGASSEVIQKSEEVYISPSVESFGAGKEAFSASFHNVSDNMGTLHEWNPVEAIKESFVLLDPTASTQETTVISTSFTAGDDNAPTPYAQPYQDAVIVTKTDTTSASVPASALPGPWDSSLNVVSTTTTEVQSEQVELRSPSDGRDLPSPEVQGSGEGTPPPSQKSAHYSKYDRLPSTEHSEVVFVVEDQAPTKLILSTLPGGMHRQVHVLQDTPSSPEEVTTTPGGQVGNEQGEDTEDREQTFSSGDEGFEIIPRDSQGIMTETILQSTWEKQDLPAETNVQDSQSSEVNESISLNLEISVPEAGGPPSTEQISVHVAGEGEDTGTTLELPQLDKALVGDTEVQSQTDSTYQIVSEEYQPMLESFQVVQPDRSELIKDTPAESDPEAPDDTVKLDVSFKVTDSENTTEQVTTEQAALEVGTFQQISDAKEISAPQEDGVHEILVRQYASQPEHQPEYLDVIDTKDTQFDAPFGSHTGVDHENIETTNTLPETPYEVHLTREIEETSLQREPEIQISQEEEALGEMTERTTIPTEILQAYKEEYSNAWPIMQYATQPQEINGVEVYAKQYQSTVPVSMEDTVDKDTVAPGNERTYNVEENEDHFIHAKTIMPDVETLHAYTMESDQDWTVKQYQRLPQETAGLEAFVNQHVLTAIEMARSELVVMKNQAELSVPDGKDTEELGDVGVVEIREVTLTKCHIDDKEVKESSLDEAIQTLCESTRDKTEEWMLIEPVKAQPEEKMSDLLSKEILQKLHSEPEGKDYDDTTDYDSKTVEEDKLVKKQIDIDTMRVTAVNNALDYLIAHQEHGDHEMETAENEPIARNTQVEQQQVIEKEIDGGTTKVFIDDTKLKDNSLNEAIQTLCESTQERTEEWLVSEPDLPSQDEDLSDILSKQILQEELNGPEGDKSDDVANYESKTVEEDKLMETQVDNVTLKETAVTHAVNFLSVHEDHGDNKMETAENEPIARKTQVEQQQVIEKEIDGGTTRVFIDDTKLKDNSLNEAIQTLCESTQERKEEWLVSEPDAPSQDEDLSDILSKQILQEELNGPEEDESDDMANYESKTVEEDKLMETQVDNVTLKETAVIHAVDFLSVYEDHGDNKMETAEDEPIARKTQVEQQQVTEQEIDGGTTRVFIDDTKLKDNSLNEAIQTLCESTQERTEEWLVSEPDTLSQEEDLSDILSKQILQEELNGPEGDESDDMANYESKTVEEDKLIGTQMDNVTLKETAVIHAVDFLSAHIENKMQDALLNQSTKDETPVIEMSGSHMDSSHQELLENMEQVSVVEQEHEHTYEETDAHRPHSRDGSTTSEEWVMVNEEIKVDGGQNPQFQTSETDDEDIVIEHLSVETDTAPVPPKIHNENQVLYDESTGDHQRQLQRGETDHIQSTEAQLVSFEGHTVNDKDALHEVQPSETKIVDVDMHQGATLKDSEKSSENQDKPKKKRKRKRKVNKKQTGTQTGKEVDTYSPENNDESTLVEDFSKNANEWVMIEETSADISMTEHLDMQPALNSSAEETVIITSALEGRVLERSSDVRYSSTSTEQIGEHETLQCGIDKEIITKIDHLAQDMSTDVLHETVKEITDETSDNSSNQSKLLESTQKFSFDNDMPQFRISHKTDRCPDEGIYINGTFTEERVIDPIKPNQISQTSQPQDVSVLRDEKDPQKMVIISTEKGTPPPDSETAVKEAGEIFDIIRIQNKKDSNVPENQLKKSMSFEKGVQADENLNQMESQSLLDNDVQITEHKHILSSDSPQRIGDRSECQVQREKEVHSLKHEQSPDNLTEQGLFVPKGTTYMTGRKEIITHREQPGLPFRTESAEMKSDSVDTLSPEEVEDKGITEEKHLTKEDHNQGLSVVVTRETKTTTVDFFTGEHTFSDTHLTDEIDWNSYVKEYERLKDKPVEGYQHIISDVSGKQNSSFNAKETEINETWERPGATDVSMKDEGEKRKEQSYKVVSDSEPVRIVTQTTTMNSQIVEEENIGERQQGTHPNDEDVADPSKDMVVTNVQEVELLPKENEPSAAVSEAEPLRDIDIVTRETVISVKKVYDIEDDEPQVEEKAESLPLEATVTEDWKDAVEDREEQIPGEVSITDADRVREQNTIELTTDHDEAEEQVLVTDVVSFITERQVLTMYEKLPEPSIEDEVAPAEKTTETTPEVPQETERLTEEGEEKPSLKPEDVGIEIVQEEKVLVVEREYLLSDEDMKEEMKTPEEVVEDHLRPKVDESKEQEVSKTELPTEPVISEPVLAAEPAEEELPSPVDEGREVTIVTRTTTITTRTEGEERIEDKPQDMHPDDEDVADLGKDMIVTNVQDVELLPKDDEPSEAVSEAEPLHDIDVVTRETVISVKKVYDIEDDEPQVEEKAESLPLEAAVTEDWKDAVEDREEQMPGEVSITDADRVREQNTIELTTDRDEAEEQVLLTDVASFITERQILTMYEKLPEPSIEDEVAPAEKTTETTPEVPQETERLDEGEEKPSLKPEDVGIEIVQEEKVLVVEREYLLSDEDMKEEMKTPEEVVEDHLRPKVDESKEQEVSKTELPTEPVISEPVLAAEPAEEELPSPVDEGREVTIVTRTTTITTRTEGEERIEDKPQDMHPDDEDVADLGKDMIVTNVQDVELLPKDDEPSEAVSEAEPLHDIDVVTRETVISVKKVYDIEDDEPQVEEKAESLPLEAAVTEDWKDAVEDREEQMPGEVSITDADRVREQNTIELTTDRDEAEEQVLVTDVASFITERQILTMYEKLPEPSIEDEVAPAEKTTETTPEVTQETERLTEEGEEKPSLQPEDVGIEIVKEEKVLVVERDYHLADEDMEEEMKTPEEVVEDHLRPEVDESKEQEVTKTELPTEPVISEPVLAAEPAEEELPSPVDQGREVTIVTRTTAITTRTEGEERIEDEPQDTHPDDEDIADLGKDMVVTNVQDVELLPKDDEPSEAVTESEPLHEIDVVTRETVISVKKVYDIEDDEPQVEEKAESLPLEAAVTEDWKDAVEDREEQMPGEVSITDADRVREQNTIELTTDRDEAEEQVLVTDVASFITERQVLTMYEKLPEPSIEDEVAPAEKTTETTPEVPQETERLDEREEKPSLKPEDVGIEIVQEEKVLVVEREYLLSDEDMKEEMKTPEEVVEDHLRPKVDESKEQEVSKTELPTEPVISEPVLAAEPAEEELPSPVDEGREVTIVTRTTTITTRTEGEERIEDKPQDMHPDDEDVADLGKDMIVTNVQDVELLPKDDEPSEAVSEAEPLHDIDVVTRETVISVKKVYDIEDDEPQVEEKAESLPLEAAVTEDWKDAEEDREEQMPGEVSVTDADRVREQNTIELTTDRNEAEEQVLVTDVASFITERQILTMYEKLPEPSIEDEVAPAEKTTETTPEVTQETERLTEEGEEKPSVQPEDVGIEIVQGEKVLVVERDYHLADEDMEEEMKTPEVVVEDRLRPEVDESKEQEVTKIELPTEPVISEPVLTAEPAEEELPSTVDQGREVTIVTRTTAITTRTEGEERIEDEPQDTHPDDEDVADLGKDMVVTNVQDVELLPKDDEPSEAVTESEPLHDIDVVTRETVISVKKVYDIEDDEPQVEEIAESLPLEAVVLEDWKDAVEDHEEQMPGEVSVRDADRVREQKTIELTTDRDQAEEQVLVTDVASFITERQVLTMYEKLPEPSIGDEMAPAEKTTETAPEVSKETERLDEEGEEKPYVEPDDVGLTVTVTKETKTTTVDFFTGEHTFSDTSATDNIDWQNYLRDHEELKDRPFNVDSQSLTPDTPEDNKEIKTMPKDDEPSAAVTEAEPLHDIDVVTRETVINVKKVYDVEDDEPQVEEKAESLPLEAAVTEEWKDVVEDREEQMPGEVSITDADRVREQSTIELTTDRDEAEEQVLVTDVASFITERQVLTMYEKLPEPSMEDEVAPAEKTNETTPEVTQETERLDEEGEEKPSLKPKDIGFEIVQEEKVLVVERDYHLADEDMKEEMKTPEEVVEDHLRPEVDESKEQEVTKTEVPTEPVISEPVLAAEPAEEELPSPVDEGREVTIVTRTTTITTRTEGEERIEEEPQDPHPDDEDVADLGKDMVATNVQDVELLPKDDEPSAAVSEAEPMRDIDVVTRETVISVKKVYDIEDRDTQVEEKADSLPLEATVTEDWQDVVEDREEQISGEVSITDADRVREQSTIELTTDREQAEEQVLVTDVASFITERQVLTMYEKLPEPSIADEVAPAEKTTETTPEVPQETERLDEEGEEKPYVEPEDVGFEIVQEEKVLVVERDYHLADEDMEEEMKTPEEVVEDHLRPEVDESKEHEVTKTEVPLEPIISEPVLAAEPAEEELPSPVDEGREVTIVSRTTTITTRTEGEERIEEEPQDTHPDDEDVADLGKDMVVTNVQDVELLPKEDEPSEAVSEAERMRDIDVVTRETVISVKKVYDIEDDEPHVEEKADSLPLEATVTEDWKDAVEDREEQMPGEVSITDADRVREQSTIELTTDRDEAEEQVLVTEVASFITERQVLTMYEKLPEPSIEDELAPAEKTTETAPEVSKETKRIDEEGEEKSHVAPDDVGLTVTVTKETKTTTVDFFTGEHTFSDTSATDNIDWQNYFRDHEELKDRPFNVDSQSLTPDTPEDNKEIKTMPKDDEPSAAVTEAEPLHDIDVVTRETVINVKKVYDVEDDEPQVEEKAESLPLEAAVTEEWKDVVEDREEQMPGEVSITDADRVREQSTIELTTDRDEAEEQVLVTDVASFITERQVMTMYEKLPEPSMEDEVAPAEKTNETTPEVTQETERLDEEGEEKPSLKPKDIGFEIVQEEKVLVVERDYHLADEDMKEEMETPEEVVEDHLRPEVDESKEQEVTKTEVPTEPVISEPVLAAEPAEEELPSPVDEGREVTIVTRTTTITTRTEGEERIEEEPQDPHPDDEDVADLGKDMVATNVQDVELLPKDDEPSAAVSEAEPMRDIDVVTRETVISVKKVYDIEDDDTQVEEKADSLPLEATVTEDWHDAVEDREEQMPGEVSTTDADRVREQSTIELTTDRDEVEEQVLVTDVASFITERQVLTMNEKLLEPSIEDEVAPAEKTTETTPEVTQETERLDEEGEEKPSVESEDVGFEIVQEEKVLVVERDYHLADEDMKEEMKTPEEVVEEYPRVEVDESKEQEVTKTEVPTEPVISEPVLAAEPAKEELPRLVDEVREVAIVTRTTTITTRTEGEERIEDEPQDTHTDDEDVADLGKHMLVTNVQDVELLPKDDEPGAAVSEAEPMRDIDVVTRETVISVKKVYDIEDDEPQVEEKAESLPLEAVLFEDWKDAVEDSDEQMPGEVSITDADRVREQSTIELTPDRDQAEEQVLVTDVASFITERQLLTMNENLPEPSIEDEVAPAEKTTETTPEVTQETERLDEEGEEKPSVESEDVGFEIVQEEKVLVVERDYHLADEDMKEEMKTPEEVVEEYLRPEVDESKEQEVTKTEVPTEPVISEPVVAAEPAEEELSSPVDEGREVTIVTRTTTITTRTEGEERIEDEPQDTHPNDEDAADLGKDMLVTNVQDVELLPKDDEPSAAVSEAEPLRDIDVVTRETVISVKKVYDIEDDEPQVEEKAESLPLEAVVTEDWKDVVEDREEQMPGEVSITDADRVREQSTIELTTDRDQAEEQVLMTDVASLITERQVLKMDENLPKVLAQDKLVPAEKTTEDFLEVGTEEGESHTFIKPRATGFEIAQEGMLSFVEKEHDILPEGQMEIGTAPETFVEKPRSPKDEVTEVSFVTHPPLITRQLEEEERAIDFPEYTKSAEPGVNDHEKNLIISKEELLHRDEQASLELLESDPLHNFEIDKNVGKLTAKPAFSIEHSEHESDINSQKTADEEFNFQLTANAIHGTDAVEPPQLVKFSDGKDIVKSDILRGSDYVNNSNANLTGNLPQSTRTGFTIEDSVIKDTAFKSNACRPSDFNGLANSQDLSTPVFLQDTTHIKSTEDAVSPGDAWLISIMSAQYSDPLVKSDESSLIPDNSELEVKDSVTEFKTSSSAVDSMRPAGFGWPGTKEQDILGKSDHIKNTLDPSEDKLDHHREIDASIFDTRLAFGSDVAPTLKSTETTVVRTNKNDLSIPIDSENLASSTDEFDSVEKQLPQDIAPYDELDRGYEMRPQDESVLSSDSDWSTLAGADDRPLIAGGRARPRSVTFEKHPQVHINRAAKEGSPASNASASDDDVATRKPLLLGPGIAVPVTAALPTESETDRPDYSSDNRAFHADSFDAEPEELGAGPSLAGVRLKTGQPVEPRVLLMPQQEVLAQTSAPVSPADVRLEERPQGPLQEPSEGGAVGGASASDLETSSAEDALKYLPEEGSTSSRPTPVTVPYVRRLIGYKTGRAILVDGVIEKPAKGFSLGLQSSEYTPPRTDIPLLLDVDMEKKEVTANTYISETWSVPVKSDIKPFPFELGKRFSVKIVAEAYHYKVYVNEIHIMSYEFRLPSEKAVYLRLDGDASFFNIECPHVLEMPFTLEHPQGLRSGSSVTLDAYVLRKASSFDMTLLSEKQGKKQSSFTNKVIMEGKGKTRVEMRSMHNGHAGEEGLVEGHLDNFQPGREIKIKYTFEHGNVAIEVDDEPFTDYEHKLPLQKMTSVTVDGDLSLYNVKVERPNRRRSSTKKLSRGIKNSCCPCCGSDSSCTVL